MNKQTIETLSISAVRDSITISEFLSPYITDNDKEPTWDGRVYIYDDKSKRKSKMRGYVSVQVKGKECNDLSKDEIIYPVSTIDMRNFLYDGGAIFFVVYISSDGIQKKIYYTTLSPVKLKLYLKDAKEQKTKSLKFKLFPDDNNRKATIFLSFFVDSKKQTSFATTGILSLEELEIQGSLQGLTFSVTGYGYSQDNIYKALFENEIYIYADIKGSSAPIPIDLIPENIHTQEVVPYIVSVNEKVYYNKITRICSKNKTVTKIGDSFSITYADGNNQINIKYNLAPMLRDRVKDTEFFIDALKSKYLNINDMRLDLNPTKEEMQSINLERQGEILDYFKKMLSVLDILNVDQDINIVKMSEQERREMHNLLLHLLKKNLYLT